jgi:hypothetical protein
VEAAYADGIEDAYGDDDFHDCDGYGYQDEQSDTHLDSDGQQLAHKKQTTETTPRSKPWACRTLAGEPSRKSRRCSMTSR